MANLAGIRKKTRETLALLIRGSNGLITVKEAARILNVDNVRASGILTHLTDNGWLVRVKLGTYIPVTLDVIDPNSVNVDPWLIANIVFAPCYIGGFSVTKYWQLGEQVSNVTLVFTSRKIPNLTQEIKGAKFLIKVIYSKYFFGLKTIDHQNAKIQISDPTRTIIDMLNDPSLGGGVKAISEILARYFASHHKNINLLIQYGDRLENKSIFKRLGFLLEYLGLNEPELTASCQARLGNSIAKLDPNLSCDRIISRWRIKVPNEWWIKKLK